LLEETTGMVAEGFPRCPR